MAAKILSNASSQINEYEIETNKVGAHDKILIYKDSMFVETLQHGAPVETPTTDSCSVDIDQYEEKYMPGSSSSKITPFAWRVDIVDRNYNYEIWSNARHPDSRKVDKLATETMIQIICQERFREMLGDKRTKKKHVWDLIALELEKAGYMMGIDGGKKCHQKWRNLQRCFKNYVNSPGKKQPEFFEFMSLLESQNKSTIVEMDSLGGSDIEIENLKGVSLINPEPEPRKRDASFSANENAMMDSRKKSRVSEDNTNEGHFYEAFNYFIKLKEMEMEREKKREQREEKRAKELKDMLERHHSEWLKTMQILINVLKNK